MTQIQLNDRTLNMGCNMKALVAYERLTGNSALDLEQFNTSKMEASITIAYAMVLACNDPKEVPDIEAFLSGISGVQQMTDIMNKAAKELQAFFHIEPGDKPKAEQPTDDEPKNA